MNLPGMAMRNVGKSAGWSDPRRFGPPAAVSYVHREANLDDPCVDPKVKNALRSAARKAGRDQRQAEALTANALRRIRETARKPRKGRGGKQETPEGALHRGAADIAMICLMRDEMLRVSEAAALRDQHRQIFERISVLRRNVEAIPKVREVSHAASGISPDTRRL